MSVLIEGMNKPRGCDECLLCTLNPLYGDRCGLTGKEVPSSGIEAHCPIRQVWRKDNSIRGQADGRDFERFEVWCN